MILSSIALISIITTSLVSFGDIFEDQRRIGSLIGSNTGCELLDDPLICVHQKQCSYCAQLSVPDSNTIQGCVSGSFFYGWSATYNATCPLRRLYHLQTVLSGSTVLILCCIVLLIFVVCVITFACSCGVQCLWKKDAKEFQNIQKLLENADIFDPVCVSQQNYGATAVCTPLPDQGQYQTAHNPFHQLEYPHFTRNPDGTHISSRMAESVLGLAEQGIIDPQRTLSTGSFHTSDRH
ncbi:hypothetical protein BLNAU_19215 [Blattamonas nauphoetae]|uniref:Uncharacterized protein n=1 Tax=Blattamonas nauphoetae TaxID=2049346 RepID=A0ABQ9X2C1_9EUKA|nr:hypothetical protein BLNAU_19215 [Blattamonas nauphoetae]